MAKIIAVDADDTLFDENTAMRLFHNARYGTSHTQEDYLAAGEFGWFWKPIWKTDQAETEKRYEEFVQHKLVHNLEPIKDAGQVLALLRKKYDLVIVTSRGERSKKMTHEALHEHYPGLFSDVHFVPLWGGDKAATKAQICNDIGASYLIDDSFEHCKLAAESGLEALLFGHYGWNRTQKVTSRMTRTKNWQEVLEYFDGRS
jgi:5'(3')-deoxyribonucleotidase